MASYATDSKLTGINFHKILAVLLWGAGIAIWALSITSNQVLDGVPMYTFSTVGVDFSAIDTSTAGVKQERGVAVANVFPEIMTAEVRMLDMCVLPLVYDTFINPKFNVDLSSIKIDTSKAKSVQDYILIINDALIQNNVQIGKLYNSSWSLGNEVVEKARITALVSNWFSKANGNVNDGDRLTTFLGYPDLIQKTGGAPYNSQLYLSPICKCASDAFNKYNADTTKKYADLSQTIKSCVVTERQIQQVSVLYKDGRDDRRLVDTNVRKIISRHSMLFLIVTAYLVDYIIRSMESSDGKEDSHLAVNILTYLVIFVFVMLMLFLGPYNAVGNDYKTVAKTMAIMLVPPIVLHAFMHYAISVNCHKLANSMRDFIHPFTFTVTLNALMVLSFVENGVYMIDHVYTQTLHAFTLGFIYQAILLFSVMDEDDDSHIPAGDVVGDGSKRGSVMDQSTHGAESHSYGGVPGAFHAIPEQGGTYSSQKSASSGGSSFGPAYSSSISVRQLPQEVAVSVTGSDMPVTNKVIKDMDYSRENIGIFLLIAVSLMMHLKYIVPFFPTSHDINFLWLMPLFFTTVVMVSTTVNSASSNGNGQGLSDFVIFFQRISYTGIVILVILYFGMQRLYVEIGDTRFQNAGYPAYGRDYSVSSFDSDGKQLMP